MALAVEERGVDQKEIREGVREEIENEIPIV